VCRTNEAQFVRVVNKRYITTAAEYIDARSGLLGSYGKDCELLTNVRRAFQLELSTGASEIPTSRFKWTQRAGN